MFNRIKVLKLIDRVVGTPLVNIMSRPAIVKPGTMERILIVRPGGIGDAVYLVPAIHVLQRKYPAAKIDILAEKRNAGVFSLCPGLNAIFDYGKPEHLSRLFRSRYDVIIDTEQWHCLSAVVARIIRAKVRIGFATNRRSRLFTHPVDYFQDEHEQDSFLRLLSPLGEFSVEGLSPGGLVVPELFEKSVTEEMKDLPRPIVALFPGASISERRWPVARFKELVASLTTEGYGLVMVGGGDVLDVADRIAAHGHVLNLVGKTTLVETAAVLDAADLLVSGDSGVLHMAAGVDTPTVSLFGPGIEKKWAPRGDRHKIINHKLPCSPCTKFGYTPRCDFGARCIADISVIEVHAAIQELLDMRMPES